MARPKATKTKVEPTEAASRVSKAEAVRAALAEGLDSLNDIASFIKGTFGMDISKQMLSSYKAQEKARAARKAGGAPAAKRGPSARVSAARGDIIDDISAVKGLVSKLGGAQVKKLVDLFD